MSRSIFLTVFLSTAVIGLAACGGGEPATQSGDRTVAPGAAADDAESGLSEAQLRHGIGPITRIDLDPIDAALASDGERLFQAYCTACHKLDDRYAGPPLAGVTRQRTPEFVMNMILNPSEMVDKHPDVRAMLAEYYSPMPVLGLSTEQARAILEYLREVDEVS